MKIKNTFVHKKIIQFISHNKVLSSKSSILVSVSGGQDSICLLKLLKDLQSTNNWKIYVVHFDHTWRTDSKTNSLFVQYLTIKWNFFFRLEQATSVLSEEQARIWRYSSMITICKELKLNYIVTGHTQNDKIETMLYNIVKGSGFEGSTSIQNVSKITKTITLVHPIVNLSRTETSWFCQKMSIPIWCDTTNFNYKISRNRIRQELIPYLKKYFNSNFEASISKFITNVKGDLQYLQKKSYYIYLNYKHPIFIGLNKSIFLILTHNIQKRIIRIFIYQNIYLKLNSMQIKECLSFIKKSQYKTKRISTTWYIYTNLNWIYLISKNN
nr:Ycf62 [Erythrocladia irregularis]